ncbi:hypothetical protein SEMRO_3265_G346010.1 [Seminavis robusta]|uniref:Uncharacterized protein n=1 Tax=Seminavis robusta TaxID=568900 RepID=A0A9N8F3V2_9STRA|nr:hypothetical protein SEMRO_3265_G346010.1 [Seminavis robusta]|eukprot:Sro3265_g346010.1 n/a (185) ;mRNA; r:4280-4834
MRNNKPPPNNNKDSPVNDESENPTLFNDISPGNSGTKGGSGELPPPERTLGSKQPPLPSGDAAVGSTRDSTGTYTTDSTGSRAAAQAMSCSKSPPVATLSIDGRISVEETVLSTEIASATARQANSVTKTDSKEVDDRKPAAKESHQVQNDDKNKHDNSKSDDMANMDSASSALATIQARFNNP